MPLFLTSACSIEIAHFHMTKKILFLLLMEIQLSRNMWNHKYKQETAMFRAELMTHVATFAVILMLFIFIKAFRRAYRGLISYYCYVQFNSVWK